MAVIYGTADDLGAMLGGVNNGAMDFINRSVSNFNTYAGQLKDNIVTNVSTRYREFTDTMSSLRVSAMAEMANAYWQQDGIYMLPSWERIQNAPSAMVPYLMANPVVQEAYRNDQIAGYDKRYIAPSHGQIGENDKLYRQVVDGFVMDGAYTNYYETLEPTDTVLNILQQNAILSAWDNMEEMLDDYIDPTSKWNESLK